MGLQNAALDGLEVILEVVGTKPLISWLQRFAAKKAGAHRSDSTSPPDAMDSTLSVEASEIQVESLTLLLCEILSMFYDGKHACWPPFSFSIPSAASLLSTLIS